MKDFSWRAVAASMAVVLLVALSAAACDPGPECEQWESATSYTTVMVGKRPTIVPSTTVYCARYAPSPTPTDSKRA